MIAIQRLTIENFQSHEKTVMDFDQGLNVIVGPSDQGKSAILRAIKWVLFNEPRGTEFIRHGTTSAKVTLELNNGYSIIRERSKSKNRYVVIDPENEQKVFEGFGNEVPEEVVKAHGIPKIVLDTDISSILNISNQMEGPFLLSESPSVRAKAIGRLTGLHVIDKAIRDCIVDLRRENQTTDRLKNELQEIDGKLEKYQELHLIGDKIEKSESLLNRLEEIIQKREKVGRYKAVLDQIDRENAGLKERIDAMKGLDKCELRIKSCEANISKLNLLQHYAENYKNILKEMDKAHDVIEKTQYLTECSKRLNDVMELKNKVVKLMQSNQLLTNLTVEMDKQQQVLAKTTEIDTLSTVINELGLKSAKVAELTVVNRKFVNLDHERQSVQQQLEATEQVKVCEKSLYDINDRIKRKEQLQELKSRYETILNYIEEGKKFIEKNKKEIHHYTDQYTGCLKKMGKCPLCSSDISDAKITEIIRHYEEVHE